MTDGNAPALELRVRHAVTADSEAIAAIFNQAIEEGSASFDTRPSTSADIARMLRPGDPFLVAEESDGPVGWAAVASDREARGEYSVYVERSARGRGIGRALLGALVVAAARDGYQTLTGRVLPTNRAGMALAHGAGFRDVGRREREGRVGGRWSDVMVVELSVGDSVRSR